MTKSRYESKKPAYQTNPNKSQPPKDSVAVFEWETFSPLPDYTDQSLAKVFKQISRDIIERPYHYDPHRVFDAQGNLVKYKFTQADNSKPPEKIAGIAVYKQNHGTGHGLRQMIYTGALIDKIAQEGNPKGQDTAKKINSNPEIKSALKLAAFCKRIGRTFDHEHDNPGQPSIYSKRSAEMFAQMATELGYSQDIIPIIRDGMLEPPPNDPVTLNSYKNVGGIDGKDLRYFTQNVLMSAHMADLTRLFTVKRINIENSLKYYFASIKLKEVATELVEMGCKANALTGNAVVAQETGVKHQQKNLDGKKLVAVVKNMDQAIDQLATLANVTLTKSVVDKPDVGIEEQKTPEAPKFFTKIENNYAYKVFDKAAGRFHLFAASASASKDFKTRYTAEHGDHLKTKILEDLKVQIQSTTSKEELEELKTKLITSPEYNVLKTGQGLFTKITGIKTSSVEALEDMLKQKEVSFENHNFKV